MPSHPEKRRAQQREYYKNLCPEKKKARQESSRRSNRKRRQVAREGFIYILLFEHDILKIGTTSNWENRLWNYRMKVPLDFQILRCEWVPDSNILEARMRDVLRDFSYKGLDWFKNVSESHIEAIKRL